MENERAVFRALVTSGKQALASSARKRMEPVSGLFFDNDSDSGFIRLKWRAFAIAET